MISTLEQALRASFEHRDLCDAWWGAELLAAWPHAVGTRYAARAAPVLARCAIAEKGLLAVEVASSVWIHELSLLGIAERMNHLLGRRVIRQVRFELRGERRSP